MKLSCIITNYNYGEFIIDAVQSALNQSIPFDEVIVVDDASTDDSLPKLKKAFGREKSVNILVQKNRRGQLSCFNLGFSNSSGEIIYFLDGDDLYKKHYVEETMKIYSKADYDFIYCAYEKFGQINEAVFDFDRDRDLGFSVLTTLFLRHRVGSITSTISVKRDILESFLPIPFESDWKIRADDCIVWGSSLAGARKYYLSKDLVLYRIHKKNNYYGNSKLGCDPHYFYMYDIKCYRLFNFLLFRLGYTIDNLPSAVDEFNLLPEPTYDDMRRYQKVAMRKEKKMGKKIEHILRIYRYYIRKKTWSV